MDAFLFTLVLFSFWFIVGFATITLFPPRLRIIQGILVSPAIGVAVTILPVFLINRAGIPVKDFGGYMLPIIAVLSLLVMIIKRPVFPIRRILPFIAIIIIALILASRPMFSYGFNWLSYANDDMANYCLAAQRFLNNGFFDAFNWVDFYNGKDYSQSFWFMHVPAASRSGSELILAVVWAFSGLNAHQIFMPVIMALYLVLIAGTSSMVSGIGTKRTAPMIAMGLMSISAMTILGALYQLIGQVGGLALLTSMITLTYRSQSFTSLYQLFLRCVPAVLVFSAIFIWYPEVLPFFGLGWIGYFLVIHLRRKLSLIEIILPAAMTGLMTLFILNKYFITSLMFMVSQALHHKDVGHQIQSADMTIVLFPYFLVPSGVANLWGIIPIAETINEPMLSCSILIAIMLLYWLIVHIIPSQLKKFLPPLPVFLIMSSIGLILFFADSDFGLYKLAMFIQPFLISVIATEISILKWNRASFSLLLLILIPVGLTHQRYVDKSMGKIHSGLAEIPNASTLKVNQEFDNTIKNLISDEGKYITIISEANNVVLAKFQALYTRGISTFFPARSFFESLNILRNTDIVLNNELLSETYLNMRRARQFFNRDINDNITWALNEQLIKNRDLFYIYSLEKTDIFNLYQTHTEDDKPYFKVERHPKNRLIFIHSSYGNHYYLSDRERVSFYQLEKDPMFPDVLFTSLGKHLLFEAINPSENPRIVMEITNTVLKQSDTTLPRPKVQNATLDFIGRGSGRIFSPTIEPLSIDNSKYISIDMQRDPLPFPYKPKGLMLLYGRNVSPDPRLVTSFGRDISLISDEEYQALTPPENLKKFPSDLSNKNLEYSGIYEDGWISEESFFVLTPKTTSQYILIRGMVPLIGATDFKTTMRLTLNGQFISQQSIGIDDFELRVPVSELSGKQRVGITFSEHQQLPGDDARIIAAKINFIGFVEDQE